MEMMVVRQRLLQSSFRLHPLSLFVPIQFRPHPTLSQLHNSHSTISYTYTTTSICKDTKIPNEAGQLAYDISQTRNKNNHHPHNNVNSIASHKKRISMESLLAHAGLPLPSSSLSTIHNTIQNQPLSPSLDLATTFERPPDGNYGQDGLIYSRIHNPTRTLLEQIMATLEHHETDCISETNQNTSFSSLCTTYSSGMAAASSILLAHSPSSPNSINNATLDKSTHIHIVLPDDVYHGVPTQLITVLVHYNISYSSVDMTNIKNLEDHFFSFSSMIFCNEALSKLNLFTISSFISSIYFSCVVDI